MPERFSRRKGNMPPHLDVYQVENVVGLGRSLTEASAKGSRGNGGSIQTKQRGRKGNDSDSEDDISQSDRSDQGDVSDREEINNLENDLEEYKESNDKVIQYLGDNVKVVLKLLMSVLPSATVHQLNEQTKDIKSSDHQWAQDFIYQRLGGKTDADKGKNVVVNTGADSSTATAPQGEPGITYANVAATAATTLPNAPNQDDLNNLILKNIDDMNRKKNIVITGMDEDYDDALLVRNMLGVMGCGFLYHDINKRPTRLGMRRNNKNRPLKVEMSNAEAVEVIMNCKKHLKNPNENFYSIYVNRDLRKEDREKEIEQRKARNRRMFGDSLAGAGTNMGITAGLGGSPGGSSVHQATPSNGQGTVSATPNNEPGSDPAHITEIIHEIEVEDGTVITAGGTDTRITDDQVRDRPDTIGGTGGSADRDGGNPNDPNPGSASISDQVSTENSLGNGGGMTVTPQT